MLDPKPAAARARYSTVAITLHWLIAGLILLQVVLAGRMEARTPEAFAVTQLHKSVGITILLLSLARLGWRLAHPPPPLPPGLAPWERRLAGAVHVGFYVLMILMPLTGWMLVSTSRVAVPTVLYGTVPWPHLPVLSELAPAAKAAWSETSEAAHHLLAKVIYALFALHLAGALKHQLLRGEAPVLGRMAPGARAGRWAEPRLGLVAAAAAAVFVFGQVYQPPRPGLRAVAAAEAPPADAAKLEPVSAAAALPAPATDTPAEAPAAPPVARAPSDPVAWRVVDGSSITFATAWSGEPIRGRFERWTADIRFSPEALSRSRVAVSIDMTSARTGDAQRDASLPAPDWFDAAAHPKATFTAERFEKVGEGRFVAHGRLRLRGVSQPLDLPFRLVIRGDRAEVSGSTSLARTAFGVGQGPWTETDQIPDKVTVSIKVVAQRSPSA